jgi:hypothetical protein
MASNGELSEWADLSAVTEATSAWAHSGLVVTSTGDVIGFHAGQVVVFDDGGHVKRVVRPGLTEGHGITLVREGSEELLWVADPGFVFKLGIGDGDVEWSAVFGKGIYRETNEPRVVKMTLDGEILDELAIPPMDPSLPPGMMGQYCPCGVAVDEERFGGSGDVWVADGYGSSLVHRFDGHGNYQVSLTGEEGGGRFLCPHAIFIDRRPQKSPELYIADRENRRVQVYDLEDRYLRTVGQDFLSSPSGFARWGDFTVVAELYGRLAVLDAEDNLVQYLGAGPDSEAGNQWPERPGWPNALGPDGEARALYVRHPGRLNSPHSLAVDADGNLYVSEWLIGGRYTKLGACP